LRSLRVFFVPVFRGLGHPGAMAVEGMIGFLGAGKMAGALAAGWLEAGLVEPRQILAADPSPEAREAFSRRTGAVAVEDNAEVARQVETIVVAVKPNQAEPALQKLRGEIKDAHRLVSIAAGVSTARIEKALFDGVRVVRVMPNTPALVGAMAGAYALGRWAKPEDAALARELFSALGVVFEVEEGLMDAVTGLSGSGPAFVYLVIEALADGGVAVGLPRSIARELAAHTVLGAAKMVAETGEHPGELKDAVASPGGTTIAGLRELEGRGVRAALMEAVVRAARRSEELGAS